MQEIIVVGTLAIVAAAGWHGIAQLSPAARTGALLLSAALLALGALLADRYNGQTPDGPL